MKESELRTLVRFIIREVHNVIDETSSTATAGGQVDIPAAFSNNANTKKKKPLPEKPKKFMPDTTFEPYQKPKKALKEIRNIIRRIINEADDTPPPPPAENVPTDSKGRKNPRKNPNRVINRPVPKEPLDPNDPKSDPEGNWDATAAAIVDPGSRHEEPTRINRDTGEAEPNPHRVFNPPGLLRHMQDKGDTSHRKILAGTGGDEHTVTYWRYLNMTPEQRATLDDTDLAKVRASKAAFRKQQRASKPKTPEQIERAAAAAAAKTPEGIAAAAEARRAKARAKHAEVRAREEEMIKQRLANQH